MLAGGVPGTLCDQRVCSYYWGITLLLTLLQGAGEESAAASSISVLSEPELVSDCQQ